ncbi:MAG: YopX family protein [Gelidibacter sp.]
MNIEIEFKAKSIENGNWVNGYYLQTGTDNKRKSIIYQSNNSSEKMIEVDPVTLSQFTGYNDKNGRKIFTNDIVKIISTYPRVKLEDNEKIVFKGDSFGIEHHSGRVISLSYYFINPSRDSIDVIGNIFDNADLLDNEESADLKFEDLF